MQALKQNKNLYPSELINIWNTTNICTILFLKLFDDICEKTIDRDNNKFRYPIHYLAYEYGLLNCYISTDIKILYLVFDYKSTLNDKNLTNNQYFTFIDRLIDCRYYHAVENYKDTLLIVSLKIPQAYYPDINIIIDHSTFTKVSDEFKDKMVSRYTVDTNNRIKVPIINNDIARFIVTKDLPYAIVIKGKNLGEAIGLLLDTLAHVESEYFLDWNNEREYWDESKKDKLCTNLLVTQ